MAESIETASVDTSTENKDQCEDFFLKSGQFDELFEHIRRTKEHNDALAIETEMFKKFLERVSPLDATLDTKWNIAPQPPPGQDQLSTMPGSRASRKRSKSKVGAIDKTHKLSPEQKCEISQRETDELKSELVRLKEKTSKDIDLYRAMMDEAEEREAEINRARYEFERDIEKGARNARTNKVVGEKVRRYLEEYLKRRNEKIDKLKLKNSTLKGQKKKLSMQLKQKEEMGEVLHEVDFNQLKIENQQYIEKIDERNQDLLKLKMTAGNTLQVLNAYKHKLQECTELSKRLEQEANSRKELLERIDCETSQVEKERNKAESINKKLKQQLDDYKVPEVMDYVTEKADVYELQKKVKSWERKLEIAEMALKIHKKDWTRLQMTNQNNPWYASVPAPPAQQKVQTQ
ncbi:DgyrCDS6465 [Dimorphilus gyrociliatus]|uniref:Cilia- and flagella-associated protein 263 n=1 Tax=Dimorphilus gyrociliatus TaxID=2664684 RepID=A0A7I8VN52_9ANNE|nr:DgyrCDS6465 [Dimorphilus gyrociliatus]